MTAISVNAQVPLDRRLLVPLPEAFPPGPVRVTVEAVDPGDGPASALSALGQQLLSLRQGAIADGMRLLTQDEVLDEVRRRRGETVAPT